MPPGAARGLQANELELVARELEAALRGALVVDVARVREHHDLLLVLRTATGKHVLQLACGGTRARLCTTSRRFTAAELQHTAGTAALLAQLRELPFTAATTWPGERRCALEFGDGERRRTLHLELFGSQGFDCLCDAGGTILEMARPVATAVRTLGIGDRYVPPPALAGRAEPPPRFSAPVLAAVDEHFGAQDRAQHEAIECEQAQRQFALWCKRREQQRDGLQRQLAEAAHAPQLRAEADWMLAYAARVPRGAASMQIPDGDGDGERTITLDPLKPVTVQAKERYDRARRLADGEARSRARLQELDGELAAAAALKPGLAGITVLTDELRSALQRLGVHAPPPRVPVPAAAKPARKGHRDLDCRRYESQEGLVILVGKDNEQNDRLTLRVANGNDLWLHVGGGRAGSHVVIRLPRGRTASLETLLDAGTLAVHFSKARGERSVEVVYTQCKHVRKPKGLPAGAVVPAQTKTLQVRLETDRLQRLLDQGGRDPREPE